MQFDLFSFAAHILIYYIMLKVNMLLPLIFIQKSCGHHLIIIIITLWRHFKNNFFTQKHVILSSLSWPLKVVTYQVKNWHSDMLAISFLLVAFKDLRHGIHIFQAQNGGFCGSIILLSHCCKDLSLHAISVCPLWYFGIIIQYYFP